MCFCWLDFVFLFVGLDLFSLLLLDVYLLQLSFGSI